MEEVIEVKIEAKTKDEALNIATQQLNEKTDQEVSTEDIELELIEKKSGFLGLFGGSEIYKARYTLEDDEDSVDGEFNVKIKEIGIFLEVNQPEGHGKEVKLDNVEKKLEEKEIEEIDYDAVTEALTLDGEEVKIAERKPELDRDAEIEVETSVDEMTAYLSYKPALGGKNFSEEEVLEKVKEEGIVYNLNKKEFLEKFDSQKALDSFKIATGKETTPGEDAELEFNFNTESDQNKVQISEDGTADFYNLGKIVNVEEDEVLVTKKDATEGEPGKNVKGEEVPPEPVKDIDLPVGKNVKVSEDGTQLLAAIEGQASYDGNKVNVLDSHVVQGNVDLSTGNIDFNGNVIVKGDVEEGMEIKAKGSVEILGSVYEADIKSGGQINIKKGFIGSETKGHLEAEGNIEVKFIENGRVKAENDLIVRDAIIHSDIDVGETINLEQGKGLISGGTVRAGTEIIAKVIGSNLATSTTVAVGITPELRDEYHQVSDKLEEMQSDLNETVKNINLLKKVKDKQDGLVEKKEQLLNQLIRKRFSLAKKLEDVKKKNSELSEKLDERKDGVIKVKKEINPGVVVMIGTYKRKVSEKNSNVKYYAEEGEIKFTSCS